MKAKVISRINMIISALIAMLGFSSCGAVKYGTEPEILPEYGVPHAEFIASGTITDENKKPIENIRMDIRHEGQSLLWGNYNFTDRDGKYTVSLGYDSAPFDSLDIVATDTAKVYLPDSVRVSTEITKKGDGKWFEGVTEVTADIRLKTAAQGI